MTEKLKAAAQQAVEAIRGLLTYNATAKEFAAGRAASAALRAALVEPEPVQEPDVPEATFGNLKPVGWFEPPHGAFRANPQCRIRFPSQLLSWQIPLYTHPPKAEPEPVQEPVAWMVYTADGKSVCVTDHPADFVQWRSLPLYTSSPQREPLTDEEINDLFSETVKGDKSVHWLCRAIERAVRGEKE